MSESNAIAPMVAEVAARLKFQRQCNSTLNVVSLICAVISLTVLALVIGIDLPNVSASLPFIVLIWMLIPAYLLVLFGRIRARTGLWWHLLNAHSGWVGVSLLIGAVFVWLDLIVRALQPILSGAALYNVRIGPQLLVPVIVLPLFVLAFKSFTQTRADAERACYGSHWLRLAQLSFWDILFLRIPHERT